jgi:dynactin 4
VFDRPSNISNQLERIANGGGPAPTEERIAARKQMIASGKLPEGVSLDEDLTLDERFRRLKAFYITQLVDDSSSVASLDFSSSYGYGSPGVLSRIMGIYSGIPGYGNKKKKPKSTTMREATTLNEGLKVIGREEHVIEKMKKVQWDGSGYSTSWAQRTVLILRFHPEK